MKANYLVDGLLSPFIEDLWHKWAAKARINLDSLFRHSVLVVLFFLGLVFLSLPMVFILLYNAGRWCFQPVVKEKEQADAHTELHD